MRIVITLFASLLILVSCQTGADSTCKNFRNGKYYYKPRGREDIWIIERNDSVQIESLKDGSMKTYWKIQWENDCKYKIRAIKDTDTQKDSQHGLTKSFEIVTSTGNYYIYKETSSINKDTFTDTIWTSL